MAKNWYDGPVATPELGILGGLPSLALTDEDKKRALIQALMQGGLGMAAASLNGANTSRAMGAGLLGGADAYGQGLSAPQGRFDAYAKQLKVQGDQIGNAKGIEELGKLKREASDYGKQNDFFAMLNNPGQAAMLNGSGPTVQNAMQAQQYENNPAAILSDPRINLRALQARVDPKQLGSALENTRPFKMDGGAMYQNPNGTREQIPQAQPGMTMRRLPDGSYVADRIEGYNSIIGDQELNKSMGQKNAQLEYDRITRGNTVVPQVMRSGRTEPVTASAALDYARGNSGQVYGRIPQDVQAQRDAIAQGVLDSEGNGQRFNPRLNDRRDNSGVRPQLQGLDSPGGPSPVEAAQAMLGPEAQKIATSEGLKASIDRIGKSKDLAKTSIDSALALQQAVDAVKSGAYQGRFADWQTAGAAVMSALPGLNEMIDPKKLANSQTAGAHLSEQILGKIKTLGANPSNADREYITKTVAQLTNDPAAFARLTNYMQSMTMRGIENHNADALRIHSVKGFDPSLTGTDYTVNAPAQLVEARQKVMTVFKNGTPEQKKHLRALGYVE